MKILNELECNKDFAVHSELKQTAVEWVKELRRSIEGRKKEVTNLPVIEAWTDYNSLENLIKWIMYFFNLDEDDIK